MLCGIVESAHRCSKGQIGNQQERNDDQKRTDINSLRVSDNQRGNGRTAEIVNRQPRKVWPPDTERRSVIVQSDGKCYEPRIKQEIENGEYREREKEDGHIS